MIVAIMNQTVPVGLVRVEEFREASTVARAVTAFVNEYTPPRDPADYLGYDTGWTDYQRPGLNSYWAYDFGSPGLVAVNAGPNFSEAIVVTLFYANAAALPVPPPFVGLMALLDDDGSGNEALAISTQAGVWRVISLP